MVLGRTEPYRIGSIIGCYAATELICAVVVSPTINALYNTC
jgi:hypothetical protein